MSEVSKLTIYTYEEAFIEYSLNESEGEFVR